MTTSWSGSQRSLGEQTCCMSHPHISGYLTQSFTTSRSFVVVIYYVLLLFSNINDTATDTCCILLSVLSRIFHLDDYIKLYVLTCLATSRYIHIQMGLIHKTYQPENAATATLGAPIVLVDIFKSWQEQSHMRDFVYTGSFLLRARK